MAKSKLEAADPIGSAVTASRRARMTQHEIAYMLACCVRTVPVWLAAKDKIDSSLFEPSEAKYALIWRATVAAANDNLGNIPLGAQAKELISLKCSIEIATDPKSLYYTPTVQQAVMDEGGLLEELFLLPLGPQVENQGMSLLSKFLIERKISDPLKLAFAGLGTSSDTLGDPAATIAAIEAHAREISGVGTDPGCDAFLTNEDVLPPARRIITTTMGWLDTIMGGGQAGKECYTVLGPTGGGKTSIGVQLSVNGSALQAALAAESFEDSGYWYYFTYEFTAAQLRSRMYCYGARIHFEVFTRKRRDGRLTTNEKPDELDEYERDPYVNSPGNPLLGEKERLRYAIRRMSGSNSRLKIVDYSGEVKGCGRGGVEEIAAYLKREEALGRRVVGVIIDYAGLAIRRYVAEKRLKPESEYTLLASYGDSIRNQVSIPFDCSSWILHQLQGVASKRHPGAKTHHSEASGSRNFSDNADYGIQLTNHDEHTGLTIVYCTKHRWSEGFEDGMVVKFDGRFGAFIDPDQEYVYDRTSRQIVPRDFLNSMDATPTASRSSRTTPTQRNTPGPVNPTDGI